MDSKITFNAPAAPQVITISLAVKGKPVSSDSDCATAARVSTYPALGMYRCSPGVSEPAIRRISATNSLGGSITGFPRERSNTFSAPCFCVSSVPTSNIRLIHPPSCIDRRVLFDTAILAPVVSKN